MTSVPLHKKLFTKRYRKVTQPPQKEIELHIQLVAMLRWALRPDVIFRHVPNGEHRDPRTAAKLKAMGVLPCSSDLEFHWREINEIGNMPIICRRMLHLELKTNRTSLRPSQQEFALAVKLLGDDYCVARSIDEAITMLGERGLLRSDVTVCGRRW